MINLFKNTSSNWVRYDKYEWKEDKTGTFYVTPEFITQDRWIELVHYRLNCILDFSDF